MSDPAHREWVWEHRFDPHIAPVNEWAGRQSSTSRWMPFVSPVHSADAQVLSLLRDPGPGTDWAQAFGDDQARRGFLSVENDDPSAEELLRLITEVAGLDPAQVCPWNAYPFYLGPDESLRATQISEGAKYVKLLLRETLPDVRIVVLQGTEAQKCWDLMVGRDRRFADGYRVWRTFSPAPMALRQDRDARMADRDRTWREVGEHLV